MSLLVIRQEITQHASNAHHMQQGFTPVYTASEQSRIMIVGQAPGRIAQQSKTPWNDKSGDNLRIWMGVTREQFYDDTLFALVPMDFYYPGKAAHGDLPPRKDFAPLWHPQLLKLMPNIQLTILVGSYAQAYYLGNNRKHNLTQTVLHYEEYLPKFFPLVHPSPLTFRWRAQNPWFNQSVVPVLRDRVHAILSLD